MSETTLTNDEKRCLQMWFRQAIVKAEQAEALKSITKFYSEGVKKETQHRDPVGVRRSRRVAGAAHKELV